MRALPADLPRTVVPAEAFKPVFAETLAAFASVSRLRNAHVAERQINSLLGSRSEARA
jgi:hypothetical protein